jgi:hypothetical protein
MPRDWDDHERRPALDEILPSLAQQVRSKQLNVARGILYFLGVVMTAVGIALVATAESIAHQHVEDELKHEIGGRQNMPAERLKDLHDYEERTTRAMKLVGMLATGIGVVYLLFGIFIKLFPVPITIMALVIYIAGNAVTLVTAAKPAEALLSAWLVKVIIIVVLAKSIHSAISYERERRRSRPLRRRAFDDDGAEEHY